LELGTVSPIEYLAVTSSDDNKSPSTRISPASLKLMATRSVQYNGTAIL
jgi:hypothetical protein